jgi:glutamate/tyrosine decarboxylase-like PLP-dependent enzyme
MSFKEHGIRKYGRLIEQNILQARYLADLVAAKPELELVRPVPLNIVCFRYIGRTGNRSEREETGLDELNKEILIELQEGGIAVPSGTTVKGRYHFHLAITNHRSRYEDFDLLLEEVLRIAERLRRNA